MSFDAAHKVTANHLKRDAYLYVRQSTLRQVIENTESTQRQYGLQQQAVRLGWPIERVHVIDCDQGQSGASAADREGFQRLVTEVGATLSNGTVPVNYTMSESGDSRAGSLQQAATGTDVFGLLEQFNDVSDTGSTSSPGHMDFLPFGTPFVDPGPPAYQTVSNNSAPNGNNPVYVRGPNNELRLADAATAQAVNDAAKRGTNGQPAIQTRGVTWRGFVWDYDRRAWVEGEKATGDLTTTEGRIQAKASDMVLNRGYLPVLFIKPEEAGQFALGLGQGILQALGGTLESVKALGRLDTYKRILAHGEEALNTIRAEGNLLVKDPARLGRLGPAVQLRLRVMEEALLAQGEAYLDATPQQKGAMAGALLVQLGENILTDKIIAEIRAGRGAPHLKKLEEDLVKGGEGKVSPAQAKKIVQGIEQELAPKVVAREFNVGSAIRKPGIQLKLHDERFRVGRQKLLDLGYEELPAKPTGRITFRKTESVPGGKRTYEIHFDPEDTGGPNWHKYVTDKHGQVYEINDRGYVEALGQNNKIGRVHIPGRK